jgi:hypothetical protein
MGFSAGFQNNFSDCFNIIKGEEKRIKNGKTTCIDNYSLFY